MSLSNQTRILVRDDVVPVWIGSVVNDVNEPCMVRWLKIFSFACLIGLFLLVCTTTDIRASDDKYLSSEGFKDIYDRADQGISSAQNSLGIRYETGKGVTQNYAEALKWYEKAASQGYGNAVANMGRFYMLGLGVPKDEPAAMLWFSKAADLGVPEAQSIVGYAYLRGLYGYDVDTEKAFMYFSKAAEGGSASAQGNLANMYLQGIFVEKDFEKAGLLYERALEGADSAVDVAQTKAIVDAAAKRCFHQVKPDGTIVYDLDACFLSVSSRHPAVLHAIGVAYLSGEHSVPKNADKALELLSRSAKMKFPSAQVHLATMLHKGDGVSRDIVTAYAWLATASTFPNLVNIQRDSCAAGISAIQREMNSTQRKKAVALADEYIAKYGFIPIKN